MAMPPTNEASISENEYADVPSTSENSRVHPVSRHNDAKPATNAAAHSARARPSNAAARSGARAGRAAFFAPAPEDSAQQTPPIAKLATAVAAVAASSPNAGISAKPTAKVPTAAPAVLTK